MNERYAHDASLRTHAPGSRPHASERDLAAGLRGKKGQFPKPLFFAVVPTIKRKQQEKEEAAEGVWCVAPFFTAPKAARGEPHYAAAKQSCKEATNERNSTMTHGSRQVAAAGFSLTRNETPARGRPARSLASLQVSKGQDSAENIKTKAEKAKWKMHCSP